MTYIEFYDFLSIENMCSCFTCAPERVILVGDKAKALAAHARCYREVLAARGLSVEFITKTVNKNDMNALIASLSELVEKYGDCVFDLTGGDSAFIFAAGVISERYKEKGVQMHRFNIGTGTIRDCDMDGHTIKQKTAPRLSVRENIRIYGGDVVYDDKNGKGTHKWNWTPDFHKDIDLMWSICKKDVKRWNTQIGVFNAACRCCGKAEDGSLSVRASVASIKKSLKNSDAKYIHAGNIFRELQKGGLITDCHHDAGTLSLTFKNGQIKKCLIKAGQVLEMKICSAALLARNKDGTRIYGDAVNGVFIDWDGDIHKGSKEHDTENEIDVMMMHGMIPVFVSCKNGHIDGEELYKLNTVAGRFGGKYSRKVLVATALEGGFAKSLRSRADDMHITVIEDAQSMSEEELMKTVGNLWRIG